MSNNNQWGGPMSTNANEFNKSGGMDSAQAQKHNPFTSGKSGPPVFYRSKQASTDERESDAPASRVSTAPPQSKLASPFKTKLLIFSTV